jgi:hypothetical protein
MFTSLDEQMKHDDALQVTPGERMVKWAVITALSLVLFGGLYAAIQLLA